MTPTMLFKDKEFQDSLDTLQRMVYLVRISSVDADPTAFTRLVTAMHAMEEILVIKLIERENQKKAEYETAKEKKA